MATKKREFGLKDSKTVQMLDNLSNEELINRYFVEGKYSKDKGFLQEMQTGINLMKDDGTGPRFPLAKSIAGPNLNYFFSTVSDAVAGYWIVDGYKLNVEQIWEDFESILREFRRETASVAANKETLAKFTQKISNFFSYLLLTRAYLKETGNNFGV